MIDSIHALLLRIYRRLPRRARVAIVHTIAPTFTVGAVCVIERPDGAVLLVRHAYRRRWGLPGGLLNRGEDPRVAAKREALEEVTRMGFPPRAWFDVKRIARATRECGPCSGTT